MPRVALLLLSYRNPVFIRDALLSVQEQTALDRIAHIRLCDDGSKDGTVESARGAWTHSAPLRIDAAEANRGEATNLNQALANLGDEGYDWVLLLHDDDLAKPHWIECMLPLVESCSPRTGLISSSWDTFFADGRLEPGEDDPSRPPQLVEAGEQSIRETLLRGCWWHISGCALRLSAVREVGDCRSFYQGDLEWFLRFLSQGWSALYLPRTLIVYRRHDACQSAASFERAEDITSLPRIARAYASKLQLGELAEIHLRRIALGCRRSVTSLVRLRFDRAGRSLAAAVSAAGNFVWCLKLRLSERAHRSGGSAHPVR